jgi:hypothetical protein
LTATAGQFRRDFERVPLSNDFNTPAYLWLDIGQWTNNALNSFKQNEQRTDLAINLTQYLSLGSWGEHEIVLGFSYNESSYTEGWKYTGRGFDPWLDNGFDNGVEMHWEAHGHPAFLTEYGRNEAESSQRGFGLYVGDTISISRFSLMLGLRAETQKIFNNVGEEVWSWNLGDFLTPRASLAVDLLGDGRNILKLGFGRFSQPHGLIAISFFNAEFPFELRNFMWIGGENPTNTQLRDPSNWEFIYEQSGAATLIAVDPDLKSNKSTKFLLEFNRQLGTYWAFKVRGIYSFAKNLAESVNFYDPVQQTVNTVYTNFNQKKRDYRAFEIELNGRIARNFMLNASYTWSQAKGTMPGNWYEATTWGSEWGFYTDATLFGGHPDVPEGDPNKEFLDWLWHGWGGPGAVGDEGWYGFLPYSVDHQIKILGTYFAPYGFVISSAVEYLSGYYWEKRGYTPLAGIPAIFPEGRGSQTTPAHMYVDIAAEKEFILKGIRLNIGLNIYNLFNSQKPVSYIKWDTELFGQIWGRQLPRWMQIKATLRF